MSELFLVMIVTMFGFSLRRNKSFVHPTVLNCIFLGVPAYFASLGLIGYHNEWITATWFVLFVSCILWFIPSLIKCRREIDDSYRIIEVPFLLDLFVIAVFHVETILLGGFPFSTRVDIHTDVIPVISVLTRTVAGTLLFVHSMNLLKNPRRKTDWLFTILLTLSYLSRFSRIDILLTLSPAILIYVNRTIRRLSFLRLAVIAFCGFVFLGAFSYLQSYRWSEANTYEVSLVDSIRYEGTADRFGILPTIYENLAMSFENLDLTISVINGTKYESYGLYSFDWLIRGVFKFDRLLGKDFVRDTKPLTYLYVKSVNVLSYLDVFIFDFGPYFFWVPLLFYVFVVSYVYVRHPKYYALFIGPFVLFGFQAFVVTPRFFHSLLCLIVLNKYCSVTEPIRGYAEGMPSQPRTPSRRPQEWNFRPN